MPDTSYTLEIVTEICRRVANGETLRQVCRDPGMPPESTFREWVMADRDGLAAKYAHSRALLLDVWADEVVDVADDQNLDPQARRVMVDARKWLLSKLRPQRYGDRLLVAGDPENPIQMLHKSVSDDLRRLSDAELDALDRFTAARIAALEAVVVEDD
jgi:hypothetical protein